MPTQLKLPGGFGEEVGAKPIAQGLQLHSSPAGLTKTEAAIGV